MGASGTFFRFCITFFGFCLRNFNVDNIANGGCFFIFYTVGARVIDYVISDDIILNCQVFAGLTSFAIVEGYFFISAKM
ncbi:MAG: hypothetical protein Hyperionvirus22_18 [Hyperionvirus sp.]|uniref:Uncharacterized protein n=1 Tax=Hyperionvirus sp. TaxID=2487770 RepID=A0A3G5AAT8_9VIRU|nr:MAG: hypothetical protein Hyperionvirus22_18 [Hyperionvirus sp.]